MQTHTRGTVGRLAAAIALVLAAWSSAAAQGMYYKEIRKDDRIYVFNNAEEAARFEQSGEMGRSITKLGVGPNGETVIGDSERALELFFFKYGISEPVTQPPPPPPPPQPWRISGYMFGDYYYFTEHHNAAKWEDQNGFWLRRAYFTYDHTLTPKVATRLRLEMNSNGRLAGGSLTPYVKDAYLRWTYYGRQQVFLGISPTATFDFIESFWGLRHIEKTPDDLYKLDSSRDFGVSFTGPLNAAQTVKYTAQFGNDAGQNSETNKYKGVRFSLRYETNPGFVAEGVYDYLFGALDADRQIAQGFVGYQQKRGRAGFQYTWNERKAASNTTAADLKIDVWSVFAVYNIKPNKWSAYARYDSVGDPLPGAETIDYWELDPRTKFGVTIVGVEYTIVPQFRFSPNIEWASYDRLPNGTTIKDDVVWRATFYVLFP